MLPGLAKAFQFQAVEEPKKCYISSQLLFHNKKTEETQEIIRHHGIKRLAVCLTFCLRNIENWEPQTREWHLDCGSAPRAKASLKTEAPLVKPISRTKTKQKHRVN